MKITHKILWIMIMVMTLSATLGLGNVIRTDKAGAMIKQDQTIQKAAVIPEVSEQIPEAGHAEAIPQPGLYARRTSAVYVYYYRTFNGWLQRRLWNRTYGIWAWSTWHNVKKVK